MRKDAIRIKNIDGLHQIMIDIKPDRCDSDVYVHHDVLMTNLVKYVDEQKKTNEDITYFSAILTAIAKTIYNREKLNYFVANRHMWKHKDVVLSFVAKQKLDDKSEELMVLLPISDDDNIVSISKKVKDKISGVRVRNDKKKGANSAIDTLGKLPNIIRKPLIGILKWLDDKGALPSSLTNDNLYYSSMIVANLGSVKFDAIYHNITNFGSCSSLTSFGQIQDKVVVKDGKETIEKMCDFGINFDERIGDGFYFAKSIHMFEYIMNDPKLLESKVSDKVDMK